MTPNEALFLIAKTRSELDHSVRQQIENGAIYKVNQWTRASAQIELDTLATGKPVLWRDDIARAAMSASASLPDDTYIDPSIVAFQPIHLFDTPIPLHPFPYDAAGMACGRFDDDMFMCHVYYRPKFGELSSQGAFLLRAGKKISELGPCIDARNDGAGPMLNYSTAVRFLLSCWLWMNQRVISAERASTGKHARRAAVSAGVTNHDVRVIHLRRRHSDVTDCTNAERDWSCQWLVSGHWRQQWLPSLQRHRPTWIEPYIKGPEDKPFHAPRPVVFVADR